MVLVTVLVMALMGVDGVNRFKWTERHGIRDIPLWAVNLHQRGCLLRPKRRFWTLLKPHQAVLPRTSQELSSPITLQQTHKTTPCQNTSLGPQDNSVSNWTANTLSHPEDSHHHIRDSMILDRQVGTLSTVRANPVSNLKDSTLPDSKEVTITFARRQTIKSAIRFILAFEWPHTIRSKGSSLLHSQDGLFSTPKGRALPNPQVCYPPTMLLPGSDFECLAMSHWIITNILS